MAFQTHDVWILPKTLCSPVLASFADSKLLDFSRLALASCSTTSRTVCTCINRMFCVVHYIQYACIINPWCTRSRQLQESLKLVTAAVLGELSMDEADDSGFFSTLRVCMVSYRSKKTTGSSLIRAVADKLLG